MNDVLVPFLLKQNIGVLFGALIILAVMPLPHFNLLWFCNYIMVIIYIYSHCIYVTNLFEIYLMHS
jgi:hypothetical protein